MNAGRRSGRIQNKIISAKTLEYGWIMTRESRQVILEKLKNAAKAKTKPRPAMPPLPELSLSREELVSRFSENFSEQTGLLYRVKDAAEAKAKLAEITVRENLKAIMISTDTVIAPFDLTGWGKLSGVDVWKAKDFCNREAYREAVFSKIQAGVTGADFAVAESGTICLIHDQDQPRLISIAPILHIAMLPIERLFPVYENATDRVFADKGKQPSHFTLITGPSMTADIQGGQFKGMHGPGRIIVILIG
ncbi:MAG: LUD domain-containing protein [Deltaproteobacteria bacterium]